MALRRLQAWSVVLLATGVSLAQNPNANTLTIIPNTAFSATGELIFRDLGTHSESFRAASSLSANIVWTLPTADASGSFCSNGAGVMSIGTCGGGFSLPYVGTDSTASGIAFKITESGSNASAMELINDASATATLVLSNTYSGGGPTIPALLTYGDIWAGGSSSPNIGSLTQEFSTVYSATFSGQILHAYYTYNTMALLGSAFNVGVDQTAGQNAPVGSPAGDYALAITNQNSGGTGGGTRIIEFGGLSSDNTTIYGNFYPNATDTYSIGKTGYEFLGGYFKNVTVTGTCTGCGGLTLPYSGTDATASATAFTISETGSSSGAMSLTSSTAGTPTLTVTNSGTNGYALSVNGTILAAGSGQNNIGSISQEFGTIYGSSMLTQDLEVWTSGFTGTDWRLGIDVTGTTSGGGNAGVIINHLAQNVLEFPGALNAVILMGTLDPPTANTGYIGTSTYPFGNGYFQNITISGTCTGCSSTSGADVHLDNLSAVAINTTLGFTPDNASNIGSSALANRPSNIYAGTSVEAPDLRAAYISGGTVADYFDIVGHGVGVLFVQDSSANVLLEYENITTPLWLFRGTVEPNADATYDLGTSSLRWRNVLFDGSLEVANNIAIDSSGNGYFNTLYVGGGATGGYESAKQVIDSSQRGYLSNLQLTGTTGSSILFEASAAGTDSKLWINNMGGSSGSTSQVMNYYIANDANSGGNMERPRTKMPGAKNFLDERPGLYQSRMAACTGAA